jgi:hypothetical protein
MEPYRSILPRFSTFFPVALFALLLLLWSACATGPAAEQGTGARVEKGIILLITFPDVTNRVDRRLVEKRFGRLLNDYVKEVSPFPQRSTI